MMNGPHIRYLQLLLVYLTGLSRLQLSPVSPAITGRYMLQISRFTRRGEARARSSSSSKPEQGWQLVGSIRFPDPIPTVISGIGSCSDPEINFYSRIRSGSFLVVQIISWDRSKLKVYPEFIGHPKFYK